MLLLLASCGGGSPGESSTGRDVSDVEVRRISQQESGLELSYPLPPQKLVTNGSIEGVRYRVRVTGDANGDGSVGPLDLNAVVDNFGSAAGTGEGEAPPAVDFNDDGQVGPLDFNVMIDEFGAELGGFHLYQDLTEDPSALEGVIGTSASPNFNLQVGASPEGFMEFTHRPPLGNRGWLKLVPLNADGNEIPELAAPVLRVKNLAPEVEFTVDRTEFLLAEESPPQIAEFDASGSTDPEGGPLEYAFDPDGDGLFTEFQDSPEFTFDYRETYSGLKKAKVRVRDEDRAVTQVIRDVEVRRFRKFPFSDRNREGASSRIRCGLLQNKPFTVADTGNLGLVRLPVEVPASFSDFPKSTGTESLPQINGVSLHESYWNLSSNGDRLFIAGAGDQRENLLSLVSTGSGEDGELIWEGSRVEQFSGEEEVFSVGTAWVGGRPVIAAGVTERGLVFAGADEEVPQAESDWALHTLVQDELISGSHLLTLAGGEPAIMFKDRENKLRIAVADSTSPGETGDWTRSTVDPSLTQGGTSVTPVGDKPLVAYYREKKDGSFELATALATTENPVSQANWIRSPVTGVSQDVPTGLGPVATTTLFSGRIAVLFSKRLESVDLALHVGEPGELSDGWQLFKLAEGTLGSGDLDLVRLNNGQPGGCFWGDEGEPALVTPILE